MVDNSITLCMNHRLDQSLELPSAKFILATLVHFEIVKADDNMQYLRVWVGAWMKERPSPSTCCISIQMTAIVTHLTFDQNATDVCRIDLLAKMLAYHNETLQYFALFQNDENIDFLNLSWRSLDISKCNFFFRIKFGFEQNNHM